jgi:hypothetical protein
VSARPRGEVGADPVGNVDGGVGRVRAVSEAVGQACRGQLGRAPAAQLDQLGTGGPGQAVAPGPLGGRTPARVEHHALAPRRRHVGTAEELGIRRVGHGRRVETLPVGGHRRVRGAEPGGLLAHLVTADNRPTQPASQLVGDCALPCTGWAADQHEADASLIEVPGAQVEQRRRRSGGPRVTAGGHEAGDLRPHQRPVGDVVVFE